MVMERVAIAPAPRPVTKETPWPAQGEWTYDDYLRLPDDGQRYEIIEGVLYVTNAPDFDHQFAVVEIVARIRDLVVQQQLGVALTAPFEVHLPGIARPVQPDVLFIAAERQPAPGSKFFEGPPDVVVEVRSPGTLRVDSLVKVYPYDRAGGRDYWRLVNPKTRSVEVYTLTEGEFALLGEFGPGETARSEVLTGLELAVDGLFAR